VLATCEEHSSTRRGIAQSAKNSHGQCRRHKGGPVYPSIRLLVAWSGLEALFGVDQEISFRLSLYVTNFLKSDVSRYSEFEKLRRSYDDRSRVAHGAATKAKAVYEHTTHTRDILMRYHVNPLELREFFEQVERQCPQIVWVQKSKM